MKFKEGLLKTITLGTIALKALTFSPEAIATPQEDFKAKYVDIINNSKNYSDNDIKQIIYEFQKKLSGSDLLEVLYSLRGDVPVHKNEPKLISATERFWDLHGEIKEDEWKKQRAKKRAEYEAKYEKYLASLPPLDQETINLVNEAKDIIDNPERFTKEYKKSVFDKFLNIRNECIKNDETYKFQQMFDLFPTESKKNKFGSLLLKYLKNQSID